MKRINWEAIGVGFGIIFAIYTFGMKFTRDIAVMKVTQERILSFVEKHHTARAVLASKIEENRDAIVDVRFAVKHHHPGAHNGS